MVLMGATGVGKTWTSWWLHRNTYACMVSLKETGCERLVQALEHPLVIVDDPRSRWPTTDRMTVLNLLAGTPFPVKVYSTSHSNTEPTHALILCNTLPDDYIAQLRARTDVVNKKKYDAINIEEYNHSLVWNSLKDLEPVIEKERIPCICKIWNKEPYHYRDVNVDYVLCKNYLSIHEIFHFM